MRLLDNLRSAERKSVNVVRRGMARAREEWEDVERRIRQRMRIYPQKPKNALAARSDAELRSDLPAEVTPKLDTHRPIVSIHGRDVPDRDVPDNKTDRPAA